MIVNDVHSALNPTEVAEVVEVTDVAGVQQALRRARERGLGVAVAGGRHAMGGQQFAAGGVLLETRGLCRVLALDRERGLVEVEAGVQWPQLVADLVALQPGDPAPWTVRQKQTGADRFTLGGSLSANAHGRGLTLPPLAADVESLRLVRADGAVVTCSREEEPELFSLVLGGYGLFGVVHSVVLRLSRRRVLERTVEVLTVPELVPALEEQVAAGALYGDFQFAIDPASPDFLHRGVFSCYRPAEPGLGVTAGARALSREDWQELLLLAHGDRSRAFARYAEHYLSTSGQRYASDVHQFAEYTDGYHRQLDAARGGPPASEVIGEVYVPVDRLADLMAAAADGFREHGGEVIYGTVRLVEEDRDTFLPWARQRTACLVVNLHTEHTGTGLAASAAAFRRLTDLALARGGSFYLTYHRWADDAQLLAGHPRLPAFLRLKREHDPGELLTSDWYRSLRHLAAGGPAPAARPVHHME